MHTIKNKLAILGVMVMLPMVSLAKEEGLLGFMETVKKIMDALVPIMVTLALIYFIYGLAEYILVSGNEAKKAEGKNIMVYGTLAMFLIISIWGVVQFIAATIDIKSDTTISAPKIPK